LLSLPSLCYVDLFSKSRTVSWKYENIPGGFLVDYQERFLFNLDQVMPAKYTGLTTITTVTRDPY